MHRQSPLVALCLLGQLQQTVPVPDTVSESVELGRPGAIPIGRGESDPGPAEQ